MARYSRVALYRAQKSIHDKHGSLTNLPAGKPAHAFQVATGRVTDTHEPDANVLLHTSLPATASPVPGTSFSESAMFPATAEKAADQQKATPVAKEKQRPAKKTAKKIKASRNTAGTSSRSAKVSPKTAAKSRGKDTQKTDLAISGKTAAKKMSLKKRAPGKKVAAKKMNEKPARKTQRRTASGNKILTKSMRKSVPVKKKSVSRKKTTKK